MIVLILPDVTQDHDTLLRARQGKSEAIAQIYERYKEPIYQFIRLRVGDSHTAEDLTAQVFLKFIRALRGDHPPEQSLRGWIFRVARNAVYDHYGEASTLPIETIDQWLITPANSDVEVELMQNMDIERIRRAIQMLVPSHQEVLMLRFDQQLSLKETADVMGKDANAIKALQFRAVNTLRQILQDHQEK
jgi:RNA polymerase sigma-70 factor (ECF subfamily)